MKKITLLFGIAAFGLFLMDQLSSRKYCSYSCLQNYDGIAFNWLVVIGGVLLILALLFFLPYQVYQRWWKFARVAIPVILVISTIINLGFHHTVGGFLNTSDIFDIPAHILMYSIFVIGSIVQIVRGYRSVENPQ